MSIEFIEKLEFIGFIGDGGGGGTPEWLPEGASIYSDFRTADHHYGNEAICALTDLWIEDVDNFGPNFNAAVDIDAGGFGVTGDNGPVLAPSYAATLNLVGMSIILDLTTAINSDGLTFLTFNAPNYMDFGTHYVSLVTDDGSDVINKEPDSEMLDVPGGGSNARLVGFTFGPTQVKLARDGAMVGTLDFSAINPAPTHFGIVPYTTIGATRLRTITMYNSILSDAQLQALTA